MTKAIVIAGVVFAFLGSFMFFNYGIAHHGQAEACGWGKAGGDDFVPQRRDSGFRNSTARLSVTQDQAHDIVAGYVKRMNPNFSVGSMVDSGSHYRFNIMSDGKPVDQLAVDKSTGLIRFVQ